MATTSFSHASPEPEERRETFAELSRHYSEREICEIVWVVSSEHLYNINNIGLGSGSDGLCEISSKPNAARSRASSALTREARP
jgi:hypothetical protein